MYRLITLLTLACITSVVLLLCPTSGTSQVPAAKTKAAVLRTVNHLAALSTTDESNILGGAVSPGEAFILTDFIAANPASGAPVSCSIRKNSSTNLMTVTVPLGGSFSHSFGTGIQFASGEIPQLQIDRNTGSDVTITVTGFITRSR